jgi:hypothetical protein
MPLPDFVQALAVGVSTQRLHAPPTLKDCGPRASPYSVHEWGVIPLGIEGEAAILEFIRRDLPGFIRQAAPETGRRFHAPPTLKPILYFYFDDPQQTVFSPDVLVGLAGGKIRYYWPPGELRGDNQVYWRHNVFWGDRAAIVPAQARAVPDEHWMAIARDTDALWLSVNLIEAGTGKVVQETERFLFYDGQVPYHGPIRAQINPQPGAFRLRHVGSDPIHDVLVIENSPQPGDPPTRMRTRIGLAGKLLAGEARDVAISDEPDPSGRLAGLLREAGLFDREAVGMAKIWRETFFERPGRWMLWRLDPKTVDELYPLELDPEPTRQVRVHLVIAPLLAEDEATSAAIAQLVERFLDNSFKAREEAAAAIRAIGPRAALYLTDHLNHPNPEVRSRVIDLIDQLGRPR